MNIQQPKILIVDDHRLLLNGTISLVSERFRDAQIFSAQTAQQAITEAALHSPDLAIADLSIPQESGKTAQIEHGLGLLKQLMQDYPQLNLMVQSSNIKTLVRLMFCNT